MRPPKALIQLWYAKLAASGFADAEDTARAQPLLKEWHSLHFLKKGVKERREAVELYQKQSEEFLHSDLFEEICNTVAKRRSKRVTGEMVRYIWELHCEGLTEREIAFKVKLSQKAVDNLLFKLRKWSEIV